MVLEIGPGGGALTRELAPRVKKLIAVETDKVLFQELRDKFHGTSTEIIHADFLELPTGSLPDNLKAIGNLPYYISTPIIEKILLQPDKFSSFFLTIQYELGRRLAAGPGVGVVDGDQALFAVAQPGWIGQAVEEGAGLPRGGGEKTWMPDQVRHDSLSL